MKNLTKSIYLVMLPLLFVSCMTQKVILSNLPEESNYSAVLSISKLEVNAPKKGQQLFTYEDIAPVAMPFGAVIPVIMVDRGDFKYYLESDADSVIKASLNNILMHQDASPFDVKMDVDFKYFLEKRRVMNNEISIYMRATLSIGNNAVTVMSKTYEAIDKEEYFTGMVTYPQNKTMNSLFNKALKNIVKQISSDQEIKELNP